MSVGLQLNMSTSSINTQLGNTAIELRDACQKAIQFFQGINSLGVAGLETIGFSNQDAQDVFNSANHMQTVAEVYYGNAQQTPPFNFDDTLSEARGGQ